jgi:hypothetical protein
MPTASFSPSNSSDRSRGRALEDPLLGNNDLLDQSYTLRGQQARFLGGCSRGSRANSASWVILSVLLIFACFTIVSLARTNAELNSLRISLTVAHSQLSHSTDHEFDAVRTQMNNMNLSSTDAVANTKKLLEHTIVDVNSSSTAALAKTKKILQESIAEAALGVNSSGKEALAKLEKLLNEDIDSAKHAIKTIQHEMLQLKSNTSVIFNQTATMLEESIANVVTKSANARTTIYAQMNNWHNETQHELMIKADLSALIELRDQTTNATATMFAALQTMIDNEAASQKASVTFLANTKADQVSVNNLTSIVNGKVDIQALVVAQSNISTLRKDLEDSTSATELDIRDQIENLHISSYAKKKALDANTVDTAALRSSQKASSQSVANMRSDITTLQHNSATKQDVQDNKFGIHVLQMVRASISDFGAQPVSRADFLLALRNLSL